MSRGSSVFGQYDSEIDEDDSDLENYDDGPIFKKQGPKRPDINPIYLEKYRQIKTILDRGVFTDLRRSGNKFLVVKLLLPTPMLGHISSVRIRIDDPEHWAVVRFKGFLRSAVSGEEKCDGLDSLKWALSGVFNLYYLAADDTMNRHPLHREVSDLRPVRTIPRHAGEFETRDYRHGHPAAATPGSGRWRPPGHHRAI